MPEPADRFDPATVAAQWDAAAEAYDRVQASGGDVYRYRLFGPAHVALCGEVRGLTVLDLGCGNGYLARELAARGARVTGVDISPNQIAHARRREAAAPLGIHYRVMDAARTAREFPPASFDLVTACLSLQDMPDPPAAIRGAFHVLQPGGRFVFSITHPCTDTPYRAWERDESGEKVALKIARYFRRGPFLYRWGSQQAGYQFATTALHATLSDWFRWVLDAGFRVRAVEEPEPSPDVVAACPDLYDATLVPTFLLLDLDKPEPTRPA
ncbi:MAG TPA: methyltransferase domain-containing protein [Dehalococcoidia bacterium]